MKKLNKILFVISAMVLTLGIFVSCDPDDVLDPAPRLFRPSTTVLESGGNWIAAEWSKIVGATSYELQLSRDSFQTIDKSAETSMGTYLFEDLEWDVTYQVRIRCLGEDIESEYFVCEDVVVADYPTKLKNIPSDNIIDNSAILKWDIQTEPYTELRVLTEAGELVKTFTLTPEDYAKGQKTLTGLQPGVDYKAMAYIGEEYQGKKRFTTKPAQDFGANVIDLRGLTSDEALGKLTQAFMDSVCNLYASQKFTIVLDGGTQYKIPTLNVSKGVDLFITTGYSFAGNAILLVNSNFGIMAAETVNSINISNVIFTEGTDSGKKKTDANYGGTYLFNFNQAGGNLNELNLKGCDIRYKRGVVRLQTTATLNSVTIENCLMDSIGGYGIVNVDNAASTVLDIVVKNSTIGHADKIFVATKPTVSPNSLLMENVTVCYSPGSNIYIVDFNGKNAPGGVTMRKCLFGTGKDGAGINGVRSAGAPLTIEQCYRASDMTWYMAAGATAPVSPLDDILDCGIATNDLFAAPGLANFKITAPALVNKVGDPRWWK